MSRIYYECMFQVWKETAKHERRVKKQCDSPAKARQASEHELKGVCMECICCDRKAVLAVQYVVHQEFRTLTEKGDLDREIGRTQESVEYDKTEYLCRLHAPTEKIWR